jgi:hypothetical protein
MQFNTAQHLLPRLIATISLLSSAAECVRADMVNIPVLGTINMLPNTTSAYSTIGVNDLNPRTPVGLVAWNLGFRVVPLSGAHGTVNVDTTMLYPASNNIFTSPYPAAGPTVTGDSPAAGDVTVGSTDSTFLGPTVTGAGANLVQIRFNASPDASGNFALQLVAGGTYQNTFWNDNAPYVDDDNPGNYPHNFLVGGASFYSGIQLGQISLLAAVPEPSGLLLTGGVAGIAAWRVRRRRRAGTATA